MCCVLCVVCCVVFIDAATDKFFSVLPPPPVAPLPPEEQQRLNEHWAGVAAQKQEEHGRLKADAERKEQAVSEILSSWGLLASPNRHWGGKNKNDRFDDFLRRGVQQGGS